MPRSEKLKSQGGYEAAAVRNLDRARRLVTKGNGDDDASVQLMVSSANVYAVLELAEAIRGAFGGEAMPVSTPEGVAEEAPAAAADDVISPAEEPD